jgi:hypothetical protein
MNINGNILVMIPAEDLEALKQRIEQVLVEIGEIRKGLMPAKVEAPQTRLFLTALEFMNAVHIRRWKFDQLIADNKIKVIKKKRKIYVPATEVDRYFNDESIL